jgi:hypothetical protein
MKWSSFPVRRTLCAAKPVFGLAAVAALCTVALDAPRASAETTLSAFYAITIGGMTIGRADAKARFTEGQYSVVVNGSTWGISSFVSDARADLKGTGRIRGKSTVPSKYDLDTSEGGFQTRVRMSMQGGSVATVSAEPGLIEAADRVPLTQRHKSSVLDPIASFLVAVGDPGRVDGREICNRTVRVFDGWQRFDVRLSYRETAAVSSAGFDGDAFVCAARYVPIAGHRPSRESVGYMANNKRLEVWMVPVAGGRVYVPHRILIGTQVGDLVIAAREFRASENGSASTN